MKRAQHMTIGQTISAIRADDSKIIPVRVDHALNRELIVIGATFCNCPDRHSAPAASAGTVQQAGRKAAKK